jgi:putative hydrolase of the HAD superfamily
VPNVSPEVSAILLDAAGVLIFPQPDFMLAQLQTAGLSPDRTVLEQAHYRAMAVQDTAGRASRAGGWWRGYLEAYFGACGVPEDQCAGLAAQAAAATTPGVWTHVGSGVMDGLRALAALGVPMGVVSNSDGRLQALLVRLAVCYAPGGPEAGPDGVPAGVPVGVVVDSTRAGVAKPDPAIFSLALEVLGVPVSGSVLHVGDSLRSDVDGALAAGLRPVHLDPYGYCPSPEGHGHIRSLADLAQAVAGSGPPGLSWRT